MRKAVFLDRDGVIVIPEFRDGRSYAARRLEDYCFYDDARVSLRRLKDAGYVLVVVTNQPDVGKGLISHTVIEEMHARLVVELSIDLVKACFHAPHDKCACRKPAPALLIEAAQELDLAFDHSFLVGDRASDILAGKAAGCRTIFVERGYTEPKPQDADFIVTSIAGAADVVLREGRGESPSTMSQYGARSMTASG